MIGGENQEKGGVALWPDSEDELHSDPSTMQLSHDKQNEAFIRHS